MNEELLTILDQMEREKGIDKELLFKAIESALASAAKKIVQNKEAQIVAVIDRSTGQITIMSEGQPVKSAEFGRIAAQTAKQVIVQKIREAERDIVLEDYIKRTGTIVNGSVHRFEKGDIVLDLGKTEAILPRSQQCQGERYKQGDRVRAYILEVNKTSHGPQVVLTRSDVAFVKKLFEIVQPNFAYFGEKDFQQLAIINRLVEMENIPVKIIPCPTIREKDGLAMSSRNMRLTEEERAIAPQIYQNLVSIKKSFNHKNASYLIQKAIQNLNKLEGMKVEYLAIVNSKTLLPFEEQNTHKKDSVALIATFLGKVRLIDNIKLD